MRRENGLTYIGTIFFIVIIVLFIFVSVHFVKLQYKNEENETIITEMLAIQGKAKIIAEGEKALKKELIGIKISEKLEEENIKKLLENKIIIIEENSKYYVLDEENLKTMGVYNTKLEPNQYYIIDYNDLEVIYTKGVQTGDNIRYKLSDFNKLNEEKEKQTENEEK